jgi:hypothetical protein
MNDAQVQTHDKHFNVLKNMPFPKVDIVDIQTFIADLRGL